MSFINYLDKNNISRTMLRAKVNLSKQPTVQHRVSTESCFILCGMIIFSNYITVILLINPLDGKFGAIALSYPPPYCY